MTIPRCFPKETDVAKLTQQKVIKAIEWNSGKCERTLKTYLRDYRDDERRGGDGKEGLISKAGNGGSERKDTYMMVVTHPRNKNRVLDVIPVRISKEVADILSWEISHTYLTQFKRSKKEIIKKVEDKCRDRKMGRKPLPPLKPPPDITIYKILERIDKRIEIQFIESAKEQYRIEDVKRGWTNKEAQYPLFLVAMDHTQLDLDVIDDETGKVIGRPYLTIALELYSRCVWGFNLSFEPPSINVGLKTLLHGVFPKNAKERYGTKNEWEVYGKFERLYTDNGPDFKSAEFRRFIESVFEAVLPRRPVKTPHFAGAVERFFRTLNQEFIHTLPGTRKSSPEELGDVNPEEHACLTLEETEKLIARYITDVYHFRPHRGLPKECNVPIVRYRLGIEDYPPRLVEPEDEPRFRMEMMRQYEVAYTREGVRFDGVTYKSNSCYELNVPGAKYIMKYDDDPSRIFLLDPRIGELVMIPAVSPPAATIAGWNRYYLKLVNEEVRKLSEATALEMPGTQLYREAEANIHHDVAKKSNSRKAKQKAVRAGLSLGAPSESLDDYGEDKSEAYEAALKREKIWEKENK